MVSKWWWLLSRLIDLIVFLFAAAGMACGEVKRPCTFFAYFCSQLPPFLSHIGVRRICVGISTTPFTVGCLSFGVFPISMDALWAPSSGYFWHPVNCIRPNYSASNKDYGRHLSINNQPTHQPQSGLTDHDSDSDSYCCHPVTAFIRANRPVLTTIKADILAAIIGQTHRH